MIRRSLVPVLLIVACAHHPAHAATARDLSDRIQIDGFAGDFADDERMFGFNTALQTLEESETDSKWGASNDLHQLRITWDRQFLYMAGEGIIYNNNMIVLFDVIPGQGLSNMNSLTSWSRNFEFSADFAPDIFGATWDGNTRPHLLIHRSGTQINDQQVGEFFNAAATFSQDRDGRSMEFAIPWNTLFLGIEGLGTHDTVLTVAGTRDTFHLFPPGTKLKIAGVITAGGDNTGGPDSAPDNTRGHTDDGSKQVLIDNYIILDLDRNDDTGTGGGGPDGVADWNVEPRSRVTFKYEPPIRSVQLTLRDMSLDRPAFAPDRGEAVQFRFRLDPELDPGDVLDPLRRADMTANIYDFRGRFVRNLYVRSDRRASKPGSPALDRWDGRDENGGIVTPGVYVLRLVLEPNTDRLALPLVVVR